MRQINHSFKGINFIELQDNCETVCFEVFYGDSEEFSREFDTVEEVEYFIDITIL